MAPYSQTRVALDRGTNKHELVTIERWGAQMGNAELETALDRNFRKVVRIIGLNTAQQYSAMWSFTGGNDGFYFSARSLLNSIKVSLHANNHTGYIGYDKKYFEKKQAAGLLRRSTKVVHEWRLPTPGDLNAIHVASVILPSGFMRGGEHEYVKSLKALVFEIQPSCALEIGIFLSKESKSTLEGKLRRAGNPLFHVVIDGWCDVSIVARSISFDKRELPENRRWPLHAMTQLHDIAPGETISDLNTVLWSQPKDGEALRVLDIGGTSITRDLRVDN